MIVETSGFQQLKRRQILHTNIGVFASWLERALYF